MDATVVIAVLAVTGVLSVLLSAVKGLLDQLPEVIDSAGRARDAWRRFRGAGDPRPLAERNDGPPAAG
ncbi:hypothetical protein GCM10010420_45240 [Streptomyces glaucosporus]|uniref:Secreted protein n=1 Tax=Streptomyces glaucosporus TaxID=284044 RepID=A0ABP5VX37_9ACTN